MEKGKRRRSKSFREGDDDIVVVSPGPMKPIEWSQAETLCLLKIFLENKYNFEYCTETGGEKLSELLAKHHFERTSEEIHRKMTHLRKTYHKMQRKIDDGNGDSKFDENDEGNKRVENDWPYYSIIRQILAENPTKKEEGNGDAGSIGDNKKEERNGNADEPAKTGDEKKEEGNVDTGETATTTGNEKKDKVTGLVDAAVKSRQRSKKKGNGDVEETGNKNKENFPRRKGYRGTHGGQNWSFFITGETALAQLDLAAYQRKLLELRDKYKPQFQSMIVALRLPEGVSIEVFWKPDSASALVSMKLSNVFARFRDNFRDTCHDWFLYWDPTIVPKEHFKKSLNGVRLPHKFVRLSIRLQMELVDAFPDTFKLFIGKKVNVGDIIPKQQKIKGHYIGPKKQETVPKTTGTMDNKKDKRPWSDDERQYLLETCSSLNYNLELWEFSHAQSVMTTMAMNNISRSAFDIYDEVKRLRKMYHRALEISKCPYFSKLEQLCATPEEKGKELKEQEGQGEKQQQATTA